MDKLLTPDEAADRLGITPAALRRSSRLRTILPPVRLGWRTLRYREADLLTLLARA